MTATHTPELCEHHYCRCMRAAELMVMSEMPGPGNGSLAGDAMAVHGQKVRCRKSKATGGGS